MGVEAEVVGKSMRELDVGGFGGGRMEDLDEKVGKMGMRRWMSLRWRWMGWMDVHGVDGCGW